MASGSEDGTVKIWDAGTGACLNTFTHVNCAASPDTIFPVMSVTFSPDGSRIAAGSAGGDIRVWDTSSGNSLISIKTGHLNIYLVAFTSKGKRILGTSDDQTAQIWDADSGECLRSIEPEAEDEVEAITFSPGGRYIARSMDSGSIEIWNSDSNDHSVIKHEGDGYFGQCFVISSDGTRIATVYDSALLIWDTSSGALLKAFIGLRKGEILIAFSQDDQTLMTLSRVVKIWDVKSSSPVGLEKLGTANGTMMLLTASPDNMQVASVLPKSGTIYLWHVEGDGICRQTLSGHTRPPAVLAFSPDSSHLASGSWDHTIKIWQLDSSICTRTLEGHSKAIVSVAFSTNGRNLASGDVEGTIMIWEIDSGNCVRTIVREEDLWVDSVGYSPDSRHLVSAFQDGRVTVWDVGTGTERMRFQRQTGSRLSVSFSSDGQYIVSGAPGTVVTIWHVDSGACIKSLQPRTSHYLDPIAPYIRDPNVPNHYEYDVDKEGWIVWRGQRMLQLPIEYRSGYATIASGTLAVGGPLGKVLFFKFSGPLVETVGFS